MNMNRRDKDLQPAIAHVAPDGRTHDLSAHLYGVSHRAREFAEVFGRGPSAGLAGLWHDLGKFCLAFQEKLSLVKMLRSSDRGTSENAHLEQSSQKFVDHSTAGAIWVTRNVKTSHDAIPLAFAIAGHHAGLSNCRELSNRLKNKEHLLDETLSCNPPTEILQQTVPPLPVFVVPSSLIGCRYLEFDTRMLFSALVDADYLDAERFFDPPRSFLRGNYLHLSELSYRFSRHLDSISNSNTDINRIRSKVRAACLTAASRTPGLFTLTAPTGSAKTFSAMDFALRHALHNNLRRVIVAAPYTSIILQNASCYRKAFGLDPDDTSVLEHHSAAEKPTSTRSQLASENWDTPIVLTTNVQLLESLFAQRPSVCRKLHNIAKSVIILDEAQAIPRGMLAPTTDVLESLVRNYGCSVVLCTATQPGFTHDVLRDCGFSSTTELIPSNLKFDRVKVDWSNARCTTSWEDLAIKIAAEPDVLVIVHRRDDARLLCTAVDTCTEDESTIHLSGLMCPAHLKLELDRIRTRKTNGQSVRVVSTQLIEAGVDLDFPVVYRALAGLDAMTQAAGRCNREGRLAELGTMHVYRAPTAPPMGILEQGFQITETLLRAGDPDLFDPATMTAYFQRLYRVGGDGLHDEREVQRHRANVDFEITAKNYRIIEDDWSAPLVIPFDDRAKSVIETLDRFGSSRTLQRQLSRVTVAIQEKDLIAWRGAGIVRQGDECTNVLVDMSAYDPRFGLIIKKEK